MVTQPLLNLRGLHLEEDARELPHSGAFVREND
jgi:hypothetical protein